MSPSLVDAMHSVFSSRRFQAVIAALLLLALHASPAAALDLFAQHEVTLQFATPDGKPMANAEVRVFAPGQPNQPALTGHTNSQGKFEFPADKDGFWSAEAKTGSEVARVMVRVGASGAEEPDKPLSPYWVYGALFVLLILAFAFRFARARLRRRMRP